LDVEWAIGFASVGKNVPAIFSAAQATGCDTAEEITAGFASSLPEVQDDSLTARANWV
jgi:hypothetical protein